jgi:hypothetical protein
MGIREGTAIDHTRASNAVAKTTVRIARRAEKPQQNAAFVAATTRPTTRDANAITILPAEGIHTETQQP